MPIGIYEKDDIDAIAETIRDCMGGGNPMTTKQMPDAVREVKEYGFGNGYSEGVSYGYNEGVEQGKKSQYDEFWDEFQREGTLPSRLNYDFAFAGCAWSAEILKPKYDIFPISCANMFTANPSKIDLVEHFQKLGVQLYLVSEGNKYGIFQKAYFTHIGVVGNTHENGNCSSWFDNCIYLVTIDKVIIPKGTTFSNTFRYCYELVNLIIEGTIDQNGFNVQWSTKLSKASITSIINALSSTTSGLTVTLSLKAVNDAFSGGSTGEEWLNLIATKSNWNISLV